METLYRKVAVSERLPTKTGMHMVIFKNNKVGKFNFWDEEAFKESWNEHVNYWLEEIPETIKSDNTETLANALQQIKKLEADKAELLEALEKCNNELHFYSGHTIFVKENESLIQKLKQ